MAEPLLNLAPKTDIPQAAVRMDTMSSANQSLSDDSHPFARVLAGQVGEAPPATDSASGTDMSGKPLGQPLPVAGKELPDASRLLELAGLPLQALEPETVTAEEAAGAALPVIEAIDTAGVTEAAGGTEITEAAAAEAADADTTAVPTSETPLESPVATAVATGANPAVAQAVGQVAVETDNRGEAEPAGLPGRRVAVPAPPVTSAASRPEASAGLDQELPVPDTARTVSAAVHQALQQRAETRDPETRFGELLRAAATPSAAGEAGARPEQASTAGLPGNVPAASPPGTQALPTTAVAVPLRQPGWDQALGDQVQWMVSQKLQGAEIRLNPAHLGPMEVRIQVQHDQANITFSAQHGVVRDALEAAIPRLREMLGESGLNLANVQVSDQSFAQQRGDAQTQSFAARQTPGGAEEVPVEEAPITLVTALHADGGSIDYFA